MKSLLIALLFICPVFLHAQNGTGVLTANILDDKKAPVADASVILTLLNDSLKTKNSASDKDGAIVFEKISPGYYRLQISHVGFQTLQIDSIHFRTDRMDFNLSDLVLKAAASQELSEVIVYAEKPLIQSKDGNITFNAAESSLSAGSNASELLTNVPLVTKDPAGKLLVRGKEPRILIDDKPVELNQQQLQDLLESLPGSAIEKIEVLTNPPPQYANEQGGVINIVTRKGKVGKSGRINLSGGTRGEVSANGNFNYRKRGLAVNINAGVGFNEFNGSGYSKRENFLGDSVKIFTDNSNLNKTIRPTLRVNADYDFNKLNTVNFTFNVNQNNFDNHNTTAYNRSNRFVALYSRSERAVSSSGAAFNPNITIAYTRKTVRPGEVLKVIAGLNTSDNTNFRAFYEQFLNPDNSFTGRDSAQQVENETNSNGYNLRLNYDRGLSNKKTFLSTGGQYNYSRSVTDADASFKNRTDGKWLPLQSLTNHFTFYQHIANFRASVKQIIKPGFAVTAGVAAEQTGIRFKLTTANNTFNNYWNLLPFGTLNKTWNDDLNFTFSYRRTIRRPGVNELNPTIDVSDSVNIRSGNPALKPALTHNLDLVIGKTKKSFYINFGFGYNHITDIFSAIRITPNEITWQNISGKKEYEWSTWSGITITKAFKINWSASYLFNEYGNFDKTVRKFRNGSSISSNLNGAFLWKELYTATGSFTLNRFANPQGTVRSNLSMNLALAAKLLQKKATLTLNIIDPLRQQQNKTITYGNNFVFENVSLTQTRNVRITLAYNFTKTTKKKLVKPATPIKKASQKGAKQMF